MNEILNVREKVYSDESISKKEFLTYSSYNQTFKPNDEIRITFKTQDLLSHTTGWPASAIYFCSYQPAKN